MSKTLFEIHSKFGHSKAIFKKTRSDHNNVEFECIGDYDPKTADLDHSDPVVNLMVASFSERFDKNSLFTVNNNIQQVLSKMFSSIKQAFIDASPLKNPQQSKLYKWLEFDTMNNVAGREGIVSLYRYVSNHTNDDYRFNNGSSNPHAKNLVAILEKVKEKYER